MKARSPPNSLLTSSRSCSDFGAPAGATQRGARKKDVHSGSDGHRSRDRAASRASRSGPPLSSPALRARQPSSANRRGVHSCEGRRFRRRLLLARLPSARYPSEDEQRVVGLEDCAQPSKGRGHESVAEEPGMASRARVGARRSRRGGRPDRATGTTKALVTRRRSTEESI